MMKNGIRSGTHPDETLEKKLQEIILHHGQQQPGPLRDEGLTSKFSDAMANVWQIADDNNLDIPFTNVIMFGPQSSGKTTITERILGFPIAVVKNGVGTTRPMVLTTRRAKTEMIHVKDSHKDSFRPFKKEEVMAWVETHMSAEIHEESGRPKIRKDHIYIEVSGPSYQNRRFVDLPGFQSVAGKGTTTREMICQLLREEIAKHPDTIVLCVEDSTKDFENNNLMIAMNELFDGDFAELPRLAERFVFAFNKFDLWFSRGGVTKRAFLDHYTSYIKDCRLVPILIGASIEHENASLRDARTNGEDTFDAIVNEYSGANQREDQLFANFFKKVSFDDEFGQFLKSKFCGFETLLQTIDYLVVRRDIENTKKIANDLKVELNKTSEERRSLELTLNVLPDARNKARVTLKSWLSNLGQIATADCGDASAKAAADLSYIERYGNDARMEEMEFAFGEQARKSELDLTKDFTGHYKPWKLYATVNTPVLDLSGDIYAAWRRQIYVTIKGLDTAKRSKSSNPISYLDTQLVNGSVYERAIAVWSSAVYRLVAPSASDLVSLANSVGTDPEMRDPNRFDGKKAKRLVEGYINRVLPAVHFLCQKMEFLLIKNLDTAWQVLLKSSEARTLVNALGKEEFRMTVQDRFELIVRNKAEEAYGKCYTELCYEVQKLFPYSDDSAAVTGMLMAYPNIASEIRYSNAWYRSNLWKDFKSLLPNDLPKAILGGIESGLELISVAGAIDPLLFSGLLVVTKVLVPGAIAMLKNRKQSNETKDEVLAEDRDLRLLGFAATLYSHFLPRFIMTADACMRTELWMIVKDVNMQNELETFLDQSDILKVAEKRSSDITAKLERLKEKESKLIKAHENILSEGANLAEFPCFEIRSSVSLPPWANYEEDIMVDATVYGESTEMGNAFAGNDHVGSDTGEENVDSQVRGDNVNCGVPKSSNVCSSCRKAIVGVPCITPKFPSEGYCSSCFVDICLHSTTRPPV